MPYPLESVAPTRPTVIEVAGEPLGIAIPNSEGFRFVAVRLPVFAIDGRQFQTLEEAHEAASAVVRAAAGE